MTTSLAESQRAWIGALRQPENAAGCAAAVAGWQGGRRSGEQALAVYVNNARATLIQALSLSYPLSADRAGKALFRRAAVRCLRDHPPRSGDLGEYGGDFPSVLQDCAEEEMAPGDAAWLGDLARGEWLIDQLPRGETAVAWTRAECAALDPEQWLGLRLTLVPQAANFITAAPVYPALAEACAALPPEAAGALGYECSPADGVCAGILLTAQQGLVVLNALRADECTWLAQLEATASLMTATELTLAEWPEFALQPLLLRLLDAGALMRIPDDGEME